MCWFYVSFFGWVFTEEKLFLFLFSTNELSLAFFFLFLISIGRLCIYLFFFFYQYSFGVDYSLLTALLMHFERIRIKIRIDTRLENKDTAREITRENISEREISLLNIITLC